MLESQLPRSGGLDKQRDRSGLIQSPAQFDQPTFRLSEMPRVQPTVENCASSLDIIKKCKAELILR